MGQVKVGSGAHVSLAAMVTVHPPWNASASSLIRDSGTTTAVVDGEKIVTLRRAASGAGIYVPLLDCPGRDSRSEPLGSAPDLEIHSNRCLTLSLAIDQIAGLTISESHLQSQLPVRSIALSAFV